MKRFLSVIVALILAVSSVYLVSCSGSSGDNNILENVVYHVPKDDSMFSSADKTAVDPTSADATITLDGSSGTISDAKRGSGGERVEIGSKGVYLVRGSSENVSIVVDVENETGATYLVLDGVSMSNSNGACISVESADKLIIYAIGKNSIVFSSPVSVTDAALGSSIDSAIFSKDDLTINGAADSEISITSSLKGIVVKDDLKITGSALIINAKGYGIEANDSVRIGGGNAEISSLNKEGVYIKNSDGNSFYYMDDGSVTIVSGLDGLSVKGAAAKIVLAGGALDITAGGGSLGSKNPSLSQKGIKCEGAVNIGKANVAISSADDCIHCNSSVSLTDGIIVLSSSDDGVHADDNLSVSGGSLTIEKSYEGLEAHTVSVSGGTLSIVSVDDGINAAGDSSSSDDRITPRQKTASVGKISISGGETYVDSSADGLDSKGPIYVSGGKIVVEAGGNAFNKGEGFAASITGGTALAAVSSSVATNFDSGAQCSALVALSGDAGTTITVSDGSGFSYITKKSFGCVVYSSPSLKIGNSYTFTSDQSVATAEFINSFYYSSTSSD